MLHTLHKIYHFNNISRSFFNSLYKIKYQRIIIMMNKLFAILLLVIACSSTKCLAEDHAEAPSSNSPVPKILSCLKDIRIEKKCIHEVIVSYYTRKLDLGPECCATIAAIDDDCVAPIFGYFRSPFFGWQVKEYCSEGSAPAPAPPESHGDDYIIF